MKKKLIRKIINMLHKKKKEKIYMINIRKKNRMKKQKKNKKQTCKE